MICYKITNHSRGSLLNSDFAVSYSQHHWVKGIGKLFVFDSLDSVHAFRGSMHDAARHRFFPVWKCVVKDPEPLTIMASYPDEYEEFWESFPNIPSYINTDETPAGTLAVSTLKLLERVC